MDRMYTEWSEEEQEVLDKALAEYPEQQEQKLEVMRYAKIALLLKHKTVQHVAERVHWMKLQSQPKPRNKRKMKQLTQSEHAAPAPPKLLEDLTRRIQAGDEEANDSEVEKLLKRNAKITDRIKSNLESSDGAMNNANLFKESLQCLHEMVRLLNEDVALPGGLKLPKF